MTTRWSLSIRGGLVLLTLLAVLPALTLQVYDAAVTRRHLIDDATQETERSVGSLVQIQTRIADSTRLLLSTLAVMAVASSCPISTTGPWTKAERPPCF